MEARMKYKHLVFETPKRGKPRVYFRVKKGPRIRLPDDMQSDAFQVAYHCAVNNDPIPLPKIETPCSAVRAEEEAERRIWAAVKSAKSRAKKRGWAFELTREWAINEIRRQDHRCALTGILFMSRFGKKTKVHPFAPSIDRIDCSRGYTPDNVRVVVFSINAMMMDWGEEVFAQVARSYRLSRTKSRQIFPGAQSGSPAQKKTTNKFNEMKNQNA